MTFCFVLLLLGIALPLDSLSLLGVSAGPCFCLRARRHARPHDGLKQGPALKPRNNRLSNGRAMLLGFSKEKKKSQ